MVPSFGDPDAIDWGVLAALLAVTMAHGLARSLGKELLPHLQNDGGMTGLVTGGAIGVVLSALALLILHDVRETLDKGILA